MKAKKAKIVLNKKKKDDVFGILGLQSFVDGVRFKKSIKIKVSVADFETYFDKEIDQFTKDFTDFRTHNEKINDELYKYKNDIILNVALPELPPIITIPDAPLSEPLPELLPVSIKFDLSVIDKSVEQINFLEYYKSRIALKKTEGHRQACTDSYKKIVKYLKYIDKPNLFFDDLTPEFFVMFRNYCLTVPDPKRMSWNGFKNYLVVIKSVVNDASNTGYYHFSQNPFALIPKIAKTKKDKHALSAQTFKKLCKLELTDKNKLGLTIYRFAVYGNGMRCSDSLFLRWNNFQNCQLTYVMMKTKATSSIQCSFKMMAVLAEIIAERNVDDIYETFLNKQSIPYSGGARLAYPTLVAHIEKFVRVPKSLDANYLKQNGLIHYKGYVVEKVPEIEYYIDCKLSMLEIAATEFIIYVQSLIDKQPQNDFIFLPKLSKQYKFFMDYQKDDKMTKSQFVKYKGLTNAYNKLLSNITKIYNDSLPPSIYKHQEIIKLSSHGSRHSFTRILVDAGTDVLLISNALIHTSLQTTQNYIKSGFQKEAADSANKTLQSLI
jgi:integrase